MNTVDPDNLPKLQTELEAIKETGRVPGGGTLVGIHEMGPYTLVEHLPIGDESPTSYFSCYVNGRSLGFQSDSFDYSLATCMACKNEGFRRGPSHAAKYFMRMIGAFGNPSNNS